MATAISAILLATVSTATLSAQHADGPVGSGLAQVAAASPAPASAAPDGLIWD